MHQKIITFCSVKAHSEHWIIFRKNLLDSLNFFWSNRGENIFIFILFMSIICYVHENNYIIFYIWQQQIQNFANMHDNWFMRPSINDVTKLLMFLTLRSPLTYGLTSSFGRYPSPLSGWCHLWMALIPKCCVGSSPPFWAMRKMVWKRVKTCIVTDRLNLTQCFGFLEKYNGEIGFKGKLTQVFSSFFANILAFLDSKSSMG